MKKIFLPACLILLRIYTYGQVESAQIGAEFKEYSHSSGSGTMNDQLGSHMDGIQTYSSHQIDGSQFFYPTWTKGSVTTKSNVTLNNNYSFLYDKVRQQLFMMWNDAPPVLIGDRPSIKSFTLMQDGKESHFVSASQFDPGDTTNFLQILFSSGNYTFLKLIKSKFEKADYTDIQKINDGEIHDQFVDNITYYISCNSGIPQSISLKEKSIEKAIPTEKDKILSYYNQNSGKIDENYIINLLSTLN